MFPSSTERWQSLQTKLNICSVPHQSSEHIHSPKSDLCAHNGRQCILSSKQSYACVAPWICMYPLDYTKYIGRYSSYISTRGKMLKICNWELGWKHTPTKALFLHHLHMYLTSWRWIHMLECLSRQGLKPDFTNLSAYTYIPKSTCKFLNKSGFVFWCPQFSAAEASRCRESSKPPKATVLYGPNVMDPSRTHFLLVYFHESDFKGNAGILNTLAVNMWQEYWLLVPEIAQEHTIPESVLRKRKPLVAL